MAKTKWTPGPWFATNAIYQVDTSKGSMQGDQEEEGSVWTVSTDPDAAGWETDSGYSGYGVSEANARLMAAAPELYAALAGYEAWEADLILNNPWNGKGALPTLTRPQYDKLLRLQTLRNAALAKARGETP